MTRIFKTAFAATGDREALADTDQPDGKVSLPSGWTPDYELEDTDPNYRPVGREEMNGALFEITESLGEIQQYGFVPWRAITGGWPLNARTVFTDGVVYKSTMAANTTTPGSSSTWVVDTPANVALLNAGQVFTAPQRTTILPSLDLNLNLSSGGNDYSVNPSGSSTLSFININSNAGKSGHIKLINGGNYTISAAATTKIKPSSLTAISLSGTFLLSYWCDGTNVYVTASGNLS